MNKSRERTENRPDGSYLSARDDADAGYAGTAAAVADRPDENRSSGDIDKGFAGNAGIAGARGGAAAVAVASPRPFDEDEDPADDERPSRRNGDGPECVTVPLHLAITMTVNGVPLAVKGMAPGSLYAAPSDTVERFKQPFVDRDYDGRTGYDENFLDQRVPCPRVLHQDVLARMDNGEFLVPYEHFSIAIHKTRRLCLFTASNVDASARAKRPEPGRDYSRRGLSGLGKNDQELWLTDPRIPERHQLPDKFFTKDGQAFDKGHVVRREDVCWGRTYGQVRRANGDTFHTTNCTPQIAGFNRSNLGGRWGELENFIATQARTEKLCLFAGPILSDEDRIFDGVDEHGPVRIQIPNRFWKVVCAVGEAGRLGSFAFVLEQDLSDVPLEFAVDDSWRAELVSIDELESMLGLLQFDNAIRNADQVETAAAREVIANTVATRRSDRERFLVRR